MSDGGADSRKDAQNNSNQSHNKKKRAGIDDFSHAIAKVAVTQICGSAGFQAFQKSALDSLSAIAVRYIRDIGKAANLYANLAGRSHCNAFDVIQGLEDLGSVQGFLGASEVHHCLLGSGTVRDIVRYTGEAEEIPFAYPLPGFPVLKERKQNATFMHKGESPPIEHIPSWLPAFPDPETYSKMKLEDENVIQGKVGEADKVGNHREADISMTNLQQQMTCNGSEPAVPINQGNSFKGKRTADNNPFLVSPIPFGGKEVSSVVLPAKLSNEAFQQHADHAVLDNHASALDTFAPAIEAVKHGQDNPQDGKKNIPLNTRPAIQFKFGAGKKLFHRASGIQKDDIEKIASWFDDDGEKDDKKRRVEQILKKSIENPQELTHL